MTRAAPGLGLLTAVLLAPVFGDAVAQDLAGGESDAEDQPLAQDPRDAIIESLLQRVAALERTVEELSRSANAQEDQAEELTQPQNVVAVEPAELEIERREQERLIRSAFQSTLVDRGGLLLPFGTIDLEPSFGYVHSSADNIVIDGFTILPVLVVGDIVSERKERNLSQATLTTRFGLPWRSQIDLRIPYSYYRQDTITADNLQSELTSNGFGDLELAYSRELFRSAGPWPDLMGSLRWRTRTGDSPFEADDSELALGSGYRTVGFTLTGVKVADPIVLFGSLNVNHNLARGVPVGYYNPGDGYGFSLGMAVALNLSSSLSFSYSQQRIHRSEVNRAPIVGSSLTTGVFTVGTSYTLNDTLTIDVSLGIGATRDSPDLQINAALPFRMRF